MLYSVFRIVSRLIGKGCATLKKIQNMSDRKVLNNDLSVQECDARNDHKSIFSWVHKKVFQNFI